MKKFVFDFSDYDGSCSKLEEFLNNVIEFDTKYYIVLYSWDCKVLCGGPGIGTPIITKFIFSDINMIELFIYYIDYMLKDWYGRYTGSCDCITFSCFNVIYLYFIECEDIDLHDITYKVKCYEGIDYVK